MWVRSIARHGAVRIRATHAPCSALCTASGARDATDTLSDVKYALEHNMVMPTTDVIAISRILASNGYYKTALESLRLCNPHDIHRPGHIRDIVSSVILQFFGSSPSPHDKCFQHVSMSLDLITMLKLKHNVKVSVETVNDIYFHFLQTKQKHGNSAKAMIMAGTIYPQFIQCYRFCDTPYPLHDSKLGVMDVSSVPNSLVAPVVVEGIKQYKDSLVASYYSRSGAAPHSTVFDEKELDSFLHEHCTPITVITDKGRGTKAKAKFEALVAELRSELQIRGVSELFRANLRARVSARSDIRRPLDRYGRSVAAVLTLAEYEKLMCEFIYGNREVASRSATVAEVPAAEVRALVRRSVARHYWSSSSVSPGASSLVPLPLDEIAAAAESGSGAAGLTRPSSQLVTGVDLSIINDIADAIGLGPAESRVGGNDSSLISEGEYPEGFDHGVGLGLGDEMDSALFWENKMRAARQEKDSSKESRLVQRLVQEMELASKKKR